MDKQRKEFRKTVPVLGMTCVMCEQKVKRALLGVRGVAEAEVSWQKSRARITADRQVPDEELAAALEAAGYGLGERTWAAAAETAGILAGVLAVFLVLRRMNGLSVFQEFPTAAAGAGYAALFAVGLLTSFHCVAMCGGFNLGQSAAAVKSGRSPLLSSLLYQAGRVVSYSLIGGAVGLAGQVLAVSAAAKGLLMMAAAVFMVVMACNLLGLFGFLRRFQPGLPKKLLRFFGSAGQGKGPFVLGLLNGFMPCGPLQSMQIYALGTGSFVQGFLSMAAFALGTVPLLLLFGFAGGRLNQRFSDLMLKASGAVVLLMSLFMLQNGLTLSGLLDQRIPAAGTEAVCLADGESTGSDGSVQPADSGTATAQDNVQRVRSSADYGSYEPITVEKGKEVEWTLFMPEGKLTGCNKGIVIPEYEVGQWLTEGENVIRFYPEETGTYVFSCWMGMIRSTIEVVDSAG